MKTCILAYFRLKLKENQPVLALGSHQGGVGGGGGGEGGVISASAVPHGHAGTRDTT